MIEEPGRLKRLRVGLAPKLAVLLVAGIVGLFSIFGYLSLRLQRRNSEQVILQSADRIGDVIQRSTRYQMLRNDREALYHMITEIGTQPGIRGVRIFNQEGRISFSTKPEETHTLVNKRAEACYGCHAQGEPLRKLQRPDRARIFTDGKGQRVLGVIRPIENEPACSNAACHAHPADRTILGVIDTDLSLSPVDEQLAEQQAEMAEFTGVAIVILSLISAVFVWTVVGRPLREVMGGIHKVAQGDLAHRLPVRSRDELGEMAESFNTMAESLASARREITDWGRTLEARVQEETMKVERAQAVLVTREKMASLGKLAAAVAHEVNNPLAGILMYARLTQKNLEKCAASGANKEEMNENLRIIERESQRCGNLMRSLLTFARQNSPNRKPADLRVLVSDALSLIQHRASLQGVAVDLNFEKPLPSLRCDPDQIRQVILALLVNAVEAMPSGGRLKIEACEVGGGVELRVKDTGEGIAAEAQEHIFEPFFTTKQDRQGTGLGLAVAHSILEQHGGAILVESTGSSGTTFLVKLPVESHDVAQAETPVGGRRAT
ncbi:MAG TPA: ATP-binding protein [Candidatus Acidoferrum sp.]|nr:ATP-binding protein [Candidatus Acidoferrum sp.]